MSLKKYSLKKKIAVIALVMAVGFFALHDLDRDSNAQAPDIQVDGPSVSFDSDFLGALDIMGGIMEEIGAEVAGEIATQVEEATEEVVLETILLPSVANNADAVVSEAVNETS